MPASDEGSPVITDSDISCSVVFFLAFSLAFLENYMPLYIEILKYETDVRTFDRPTRRTIEFPLHQIPSKWLAASAPGNATRVTYWTGSLRRIARPIRGIGAIATSAVRRFGLTFHH